MGQIGTILSMFGIGYGISKLIMGTLADRANPNRYVATGLIVSAIINALYGTTQSFGMIVFLMLLNSVMRGMGAAACQRLVGLWFGRKAKGSIMARGTAFSIWSSAHNAGAFMCVAVINLSAFFFGASLQWSFWTASIVSIVIAIIVLFLVLTVQRRKDYRQLKNILATKWSLKTEKLLKAMFLMTMFLKYFLNTLSKINSCGRSF